MTGNLATGTAIRGAMAVWGSERRVASWAVQVLVPGLLAVLHPSVGGLTSAGAQLLVGGSVLVASGIRLRLLARGSAVLVVLAHGLAPGQLVGMLTHGVTCAVETVLLVALLSLLHSRRSPVPAHSRG